MNDKYFLYIDILAFAGLVDKNPAKIEQIFEAINRLNAHKDQAFKTIAFSDTILIYNLQDPINEEQHEQIVMLLCEFASDLLMWAIKLDFQFRAVLLSGDFHYERKEHIEAYYGNALIRAYNKEKEITGMGLFIAKDIAHLNTCYRMVPFDKDLNFVFVTQGLRDLNFFGPGDLPVDFTLLEGPTPTYLAIEISMLKDLKKNIDTLEDAKVRAKFLQTYHLYKAHYHWLVEPLEKADFDPTIICSKVDWKDSTADWWKLDDADDASEVENSRKAEKNSKRKQK
jgi:hypothetical protein